MWPPGYFGYDTGAAHGGRPIIARWNVEVLEHVTLEHLTLEMLTRGRQKPACSHFVAMIFRKILAEQLTHFIR